MEKYTDSSFISETYFTPQEIQFLKTIELDGVSLNGALENLFQKRTSNICSSHDLYPLYFKYFGLNKKDFSNKNIKKSRREWEKWYKLMKYI